MTDNERPLVTFALFAYNQERFIREAVEGAFAQTYSPLEIILSDDCSSDRTFEVIQEMAAAYTGPHQLKLNRNQANQGLGGHINAVMRLARGDLVVVGAADDISMPQRAERIASKWVGEGCKADLICSDYGAMSETGSDLEIRNGCNLGSLTPEKMARFGHGVLGATSAWTSRLWRTFGELPQGTLWEDQVLPFRAILGGGIDSIGEPLVRYRIGVSTWIAVGSAGYREIQRRNGVLALNQYKNALTARDDAIRAGRQDLVDLTRIRVMECDLLHRIHTGEGPTYREIIGGIFLGVRLRLITRAIVRRKLPAMHALVHAVRQLRAGGGS